MKTKILLLTLFASFLLVTNLSAQNPTLVWAKQMGESGHDHGNSIAIDAKGNVYTAGDFSGTVDFDPGLGTANLTSLGGLDIFIQKLDANGSLLWVKQMGGENDDEPTSITIDTKGNVYTTGIFIGTVDFDPGAGTAKLTSFGSRDIFIQKLDTNGKLLWVKQMGGKYVDYVYSITTDANGNVYITGTFIGTADFDPGAGTFNLTSEGYEDIFIQKLDANGNLLWVKQMGGTVNDRGLSITTVPNGNIYTTGVFSGTVDFDPGVGTVNLTSVGNHDNFIQKLDTNGNLLWVKQMGGAGYTYVSSITTDANGNVYTTGAFEATVDFDPGTGTFNLTAFGSRDFFIQKLDTNGNLLWAKHMGGIGMSDGSAITTGANGDVYTIGNFSGTADFDPGVGTTNLTAVGNFDIFIHKLNSNGNLLWVKQMGGTGFDTGSSIINDASGNVYTTGRFSGTADFDLGAGTANLTSAGSYDIFILKLSQTTVGLSENSFSEKYVVYPNPTNGKFSIKFENIQNSVTVRILSLTGQLIVNKQFQKSNNIQLELNQPKGIYMLEAIDEQGNIAATKILKN